MTYQIVYTISALKELSHLPEADIKKIKAAIESLSKKPFPPGSLKLEGTNEKLYRIRKGNYRVIYFVQNDTVIITILKIAHRKDVYRF